MYVHCSTYRGILVYFSGNWNVPNLDNVSEYENTVDIQPEPKVIGTNVTWQWNYQSPFSLASSVMVKNRWSCYVISVQSLKVKNCKMLCYST